jgi:preprotein translocase subunit SecG
MYNLVLLVHMLIAVVLIALVLLQQGKGASIGASFGAGASQTVFGSAGSGSFLLKFTGGLALLFFVSSLTLGYLTFKQTKASSPRPKPVETSVPVEAPAAPVSAPVELQPAKPVAKPNATAPVAPATVPAGK